MSKQFTKNILQWFAVHGRKDLPWQHDRTAYRVWVSEIMLQQTRVETVIPYFEKFMQRFPDISALAKAPLDDVLGLWSGLGYYARARNMHKAAIIIHDEYAGSFPEDFERVIVLPGIGESTAGAILSLALNQPHAILDGNVKRVLARHEGIEGWPGTSTVQKKLWEIARGYTPAKAVADYNQAMMDMGATVCTRSKPNCAHCPVEKSCYASKNAMQKELPASKPKKTLPVRQTNMFVITNLQGEVLLEKRPPSGIWGGLWCLPQNQDAEVPAGSVDIEIESLEQPEGFRHTFSHFHLDIQPFIARSKSPASCVMENDRYVWYKMEQLPGLGLPQPVRRILDQYIEKQE